jgi:hypothetical protein
MEERVVSFSWEENVKVHPGDIPENTTHLIFGNLFNQELKRGVIPKGVYVLSLGSSFNSNIEEGAIPSSVRYLIFGNSFNQTMAEGDIPEGVTHLWFGRDFNRPISPGVLPLTLTDLEFGYSFNKPIIQGVFPPNLKRLVFGESFDHEIGRKVLPIELKGIAFRGYYMKSFRYLPIELEKLIIRGHAPDVNAAVELSYRIIEVSSRSFQIIIDCGDKISLEMMRNITSEVSLDLQCYENDDYSVTYPVHYESSEDSNSTLHFEEETPQISDTTRLANTAIAEERMRLIRERNENMEIKELEEEEEDKPKYPDISDEEAETLKHKCNNDTDFMGENLPYKTGVQAILNITRDDKYVAYCYNYGELIRSLESHDYRVVVWVENEYGSWSPDLTRPVYKEPYLGFWIDNEGYENSKIYNTLVAIPLKKERLGTSVSGDVASWASRMHGTEDDIHDIYTLRPINFRVFHDKERITRSDIDNFRAEERDYLPLELEEEISEDMRKIIDDGLYITQIENPTNKMKLAAVKENGYAIGYIKNPTEQMKREAVKQNGIAIRMIDDPSDELKWEALRQNRLAIHYIQNPTDEMVEFSDL